jgi:hypothetical protein
LVGKFYESFILGKATRTGERRNPCGIFGKSLGIITHVKLVLNLGLGKSYKPKAEGEDGAAAFRVSL